MKMTGYLILTLLVIVVATLPDKSQLLNLEDVPNYQTARVDQEVNPKTLSTLPSKKSIGKLEESALARGSCSSKVLVHYTTKNDAYTQRSYIYGYYKLAHADATINGKPYYSSMFANGRYAIWYSNIGHWMIGYSSQQGTTYGFAYNSNNYKCPYYPAYDWKYLDYYQNWCSAGKGLSIWSASADLNGDGKLLSSLYLSGKLTEGDHQTNKQIAHQPEWFTKISKAYADLNGDGQPELLEASLHLFKSGKITEEDHHRNTHHLATVNKQSADLPEWFTKMDKNQDEFIQQKELDSDY